MKRQEITRARTILIKISTEIVNEDNGHIALGIMGHLVQQITKFHEQGKRIILVSSGAVSTGKIVLRKQHMLYGSLQEHLEGRSTREVQLQLKACAAAGQSGLQALYGTLFGNYDVLCSQILLSDSDFYVEESRKNLKTTLQTLLDFGMIPIVNENDIISSRKIPLTDEMGKRAWDNDSLAALIAREMCVDLMIILTDFSALERKTITKDNKTTSDFVDTFDHRDTIIPCSKSRVGLDGQKYMLEALLSSVTSGKVKFAVLANGLISHSLDRILAGERIGTLFTPQLTSLSSSL